MQIRKQPPNRIFGWLGKLVVVRKFIGNNLGGGGHGSTPTRMISQEAFTEEFRDEYYSKDGVPFLLRFGTHVASYPHRYGC